MKENDLELMEIWIKYELRGRRRGIIVFRGFLVVFLLMFLFFLDISHSLIICLINSENLFFVYIQRVARRYSGSLKGGCPGENNVVMRNIGLPNNLCYMQAFFDDNNCFNRVIFDDNNCFNRVIFAFILLVLLCY